MDLKQIKRRIIHSQLLKDSFWSLFGNIVFRGLSLAGGIIIARLLGKDVFGEFVFVKTTVTSLAVFSTFGFGYTATKYVADLKVKDPEKINLFIYYANRITLVFSLSIAFLLFFSASFLSKQLTGTSDMTTALKILSLLIVANALLSLHTGILAGLGMFKKMATINVKIGILSFLLSVVLTYFYKLEGAWLMLLIVQVFNWYLYHKEIKSQLGFSFTSLKIHDKKLLNQIIRFTTPVALQEGVFAVLYWISGLLLIKYFTFGELGLYNASYQWYSAILFIPGVLRNVVLSHLSKSNENILLHNKIIKQTIWINIFSTLIPACFIFVFSQFIESFYGNTFKGLGLLITICVVGSVFTSVSNVYAQAFMSKNMNWEMFFIRLVRDGGSLLLFLSLFEFYNYGAKLMIFSQLLFNITFLILMILIYRIKVKTI